MTEHPQDYPDPTENLHNRPICVYMTDIPKDFDKKDIEYIFGKVSQQYLTVTSIEFVPCFYDPYDKKCAYVYFDSWYSASEEIAIIECHFILNTFYRYTLPRTWTQYWSGEPITSLKMFYCRRPIRSQGIKENWNLIKEQNIFQEIRRQAHQIRYLKKRIYTLEDNLNPVPLIVPEEDTDDYDTNSYHHIM